MKPTEPDWNGYWYHFTDRDNLPGILRDGIHPRGNRRANYHGKGLDSNPSYGYLTNKILRPWHGMAYEHMVVLAIMDYWLDSDLYRPDEDDPEYRGKTTIAYEGVIEPGAIDIIYSFEPVRDDRGVLSYNMVTLSLEVA